MLYDIYVLLCIQYLTPDDGQKTCPKRVEFYSKNKFEKLVHLIGFIIRIIVFSYCWSSISAPFMGLQGSTTYKSPPPHNTLSGPQSTLSTYHD